MSLDVIGITFKKGDDLKTGKPIMFLASWVKSGGRIDDFDGISSWLKNSFGLNEDDIKDVFQSLNEEADDTLVESAKVNREEQNRDLRNKKMAAAAVLGLNPLMAAAIAEGNEEVITLAAISLLHK
jgi:hypothetical protein